jgi:hypothetical protein
MTFKTVKCWTKRAMREPDEKNINETSSRFVKSQRHSVLNVGFACAYRKRHPNDGLVGLC